MVLSNARSRWHSSKDLLAVFNGEAKKAAICSWRSIASCISASTRKVLLYDLNRIMIYGFFAGLSGFTHPHGLEEKGVVYSLPQIALTSSGVLFLAEHSCTPVTSLETITDKSKIDHITEGLALLQASWIIIQCIAHLVSQLPATLLEILTTGHVIPALIVCLPWWNKSLSVEILGSVTSKIRQVAAPSVECAIFLSQKNEHLPARI